MKGMKYTLVLERSFLEGVRVYTRIILFASMYPVHIKLFHCTTSPKPFNVHRKDGVPVLFYWAILAVKSTVLHNRES